MHCSMLEKFDELILATSSRFTPPTPQQLTKTSDSRGGLELRVFSTSKRNNSFLQNCCIFDSTSVGLDATGVPRATVCSVFCDASKISEVSP
jgi:hypothetical protein